MPTSYPQQISDVLATAMALSPTKVLDVGIGTGKYGMLMREYLDIWPGRLDRADWKTQIFGIEAFEGYRSPAWSYYDRVEIGDARSLLNSFSDVDLVTMFDVIEHFSKDEGIEFLKACLKRAQWVLITTPKDFHEQPECGMHSNEYEHHLSHWSKQDFKTIALYSTHIQKHKYQMALISSTDSKLPNLNAILRKEFAGLVEVDLPRLSRRLPFFVRKPAKWIAGRSLA